MTVLSMGPTVISSWSLCPCSFSAAASPHAACQRLYHFLSITYHVSPAFMRCLLMGMMVLSCSGPAGGSILGCTTAAAASSETSGSVELLLLLPEPASPLPLMSIAANFVAALVRLLLVDDDAESMLVLLWRLTNACGVITAMSQSCSDLSVRVMLMGLRVHGRCGERSKCNVERA